MIAEKVGKFFSWATAYCRKSSWKDLALIKFCLCAEGVLAGLCVPPGKRKKAALGALLIFLIASVPLMFRFFRVVKEEQAAEEEDEEDYLDYYEIDED